MKGLSYVSLTSVLSDFLLGVKVISNLLNCINSLNNIIYFFFFFFCGFDLLKHLLKSRYPTFF